MPLINPKELLLKKKQEGKAVGAFNVISLEMIRGVIDAAEEMKEPLILQLSSNALKWAKFEYIVPMIISAARNAKVDIAVHLDHSNNLDEIQKSIDAGMLSVMYDGSKLDYKDNVKISNQVIDICKDNIFVEIEIGSIGGKEGDSVESNDKFISPQDAIEFYNATKPGALAVAFGTSHGLYKSSANLNYKLIQDISKAIPVPLVMHGTSGLPFEMIKKAIKSGITKVNVGQIY